MVLEYSNLYSVQNPDTSVTPSICTAASCDPTICTSSGSPAASCTSCYQYEYCRNTKNADALHSGKQLSQMQENLDVDFVYEGDYIKSINLIVGIIGVFSFIFYNK
jgi:hypothetical protein